jgi:GTP-binding protein LepA
MLHLEIISERLYREFSLELIVTLPSITYQVILKNDKEITVYSPHLFPNDGEVKSVREPWVLIHIMTPNTYLGNISTLSHEHEGEVVTMQTFGDGRTKVDILMPLRELMRNFFDELKSTTILVSSTLLRSMLDTILCILSPMLVIKIDSGSISLVGAYLYHL